MRRTLMLLFACVPIPGCGAEPAYEPLAPNASILFLTIDTLRYEHVGIGGSQRQTSPALDRLAQQGVFFKKCYAQSAWTLPSMVSLITSMTPAELGIEESAHRDEETGKWIAGGVAPEIETLAEIFTEHGFRTAGFSSNGHLSRKQGFDQGFADFDDSTLLWKGAEDVFGAALTWLDGVGDDRFFLWTHLFDPHADAWGQPPVYKVPEGFEAFFPEAVTETIEEETKLAYDRKIRAMDQQIGVFLRELNRRGLLEDLILVVAVDHGEEFFEEGRWGHSKSVRESLVHVPMWIRLPKSLYAGTVVERVVQNLDAAPTMLDLIGIRTPPSMDGTSLVPLFASDRDRRMPAEAPVYGETKRQGVELLFWLDPARGRKLVVDRVGSTRRLYDLEADPEERNDLANAEPAVAEELERALEAYLASRKPGVRMQTELSDDMVEEMRGMGYIGDDE